jgi:tetratricopeptide (TPR) repeat protein
MQISAPLNNDKDILSALELDILKQYYVKLEAIDECTPLVQPDNFDWNSSSQAIRLRISIEFNALTIINPEHVKEIFSDSVDTIHQYLTERTEVTKNSLLKAKYFHLLYCLTKNNKDINQAIEEYKSALNTCLENYQDQNRHIKFKQILDVVIQLTKNSKYKTEELKEQIHNYLKSLEIYDRMKTWIILSISKSNLFKIKELDYVPQLCIDLSKKETEHRFIEINLEVGLEISIKLQDIENQKNINELLGDNEYKRIRSYDGRPESIVVPHYNSNTYIKMIQYYKNARNTDKRNKAILEYNSNKKLCKFLKITSTVKTTNDVKLQSVMEELLFAIIGSSSSQILAELISGNNLFFIPHQLLDKYIVEKEETPILFKSVLHDINNNSKEIEKEEHLAFTTYSVCLSRTVSFTTDIIIASLMKNKLTYNKVEKILSGRSFFGQELIITRGGEDFAYTWFSMIDIGLRDFIKQFNALLKNKNPDWRFSIDFLSLKFEGILRDIVGLVDGVITKVDNKGNTSDMLLDDLLRSDAIGKVFNKDDINLFQYIFTSKGYNIRNNVAHSFYKPHDYTIKKAVLVFLCILRLAKFNYKPQNIA